MFQYHRDVKTLGLVLVVAAAIGLASADAQAQSPGAPQHMWARLLIAGQPIYNTAETPEDVGIAPEFIPEDASYITDYAVDGDTPTGTTRANPRLNAVRVRLRPDSVVSPALRQAMDTRQRIDLEVLVFSESDDALVEAFYTLEHMQGLVSSYRIAMSEEGVMLEEYTFRFLVLVETHEDGTTGEYAQEVAP